MQFSQGKIIFFNLPIRNTEQLNNIGIRTYETSELGGMTELKTQLNFSSEKRFKILNPHDALAEASCLFIAEPENL